MDDNKLNKLREIGYTINKCCWSCKHSELNGLWGTCQLHTYEHKKHEGGDKGSERQLSIYAHGCCENYEIREWVIDTFHGYREFCE